MKAAVKLTPVNVSKVPGSDICSAATKRFYSITSSASASSVGGNVEAERLGGLEVDDELEFGGLHDRQVGRLLALENPTDIHAGLAIGIGYGLTRNSSGRRP